MQRTIDAMRIESKKQLHEDFKLKLADLLATLEHSQGIAISVWLM